MEGLGGGVGRELSPEPGLVGPVTMVTRRGAWERQVGGDTAFFLFLKM